MNLGKEMNIDLDELPPSKKFKQGRLPFKPLDHSSQKLTGTTPPGGKKRKLSDNESPSAKLPKTVPVKNLIKPLVNNGDHEVSSSSEADTSVHIGHVKGVPKPKNTLDRFFKAKPSTVNDQEEITSTITECIPIDLTEDTAENEDKNTTNKNKTEINQTQESDVIGVDTKAVTSKHVHEGDTVTSAKNKEASIDSTESAKTEISCADKDGEINEEDKENVVCCDEDGDEGDRSFVSDTSVCENALKTPAKGTVAESVMKTPVVGSSGISVSTPVSVQSPGSAGDATPVSGRQKVKRESSVKLSESKKKEREELRLKQKAEREMKLEERKQQKEKEKEEKEKERLEKKKQLEEKKMEKEKQKQEEKDKREKERLEKLQQKEEEKKTKEKDLEAKQEEKRKRDEEKRQKDEEKRLTEEEKKKEEDEKLKKEEKKKTMFKGFFIKKAPTVSPPKTKETKSQFFMPFEVKPNMRLAPQQRRSPVSTEAKHQLDTLLQSQECDVLYTTEIKSPAYKPGQSTTTLKRSLVEENDVEILSHEKETIDKVTHHAKFLYFHENTRPAYYGTWTKLSTTLTPRNPFKQDEQLFDYEIDSDDEWEEEEPGESVSSDEEEDEGEKVVEEEEEVDDWMVPHGYLSDGEGVDDDEEVDCASKQDLQKGRQAAWESELKRQAKPLKMLSIGCVWQDDDTTAIAAQQLHKLIMHKAVCLTDGPISTSYTQGRSDATDTMTTKGSKSDDKAKRNPQRKSVPAEALPDLIRLLHGNPSGIKKLIKEFRMFWKLKTNPTTEKSESEPNGDTSTMTPNPNSSNLDMSMDVDEKPDAKSDVDKSNSPSEGIVEKQDDFAISKRQLEIKIPAIAVREKRQDQRKICYYVKPEILAEYKMEDIKLPNSWEYVCVKEPLWATASNKSTPKTEEASSVASSPAPNGGRATPNIMKFAQPMSPSMIQSIAAEKLASKEPPVSIDLTVTSVQDPVTVKPVLVSDQISIKDMFSKKPTSLANAKADVPAVAKPLSETTPVLNNILKSKPVSPVEVLVGIARQSMNIAKTADKAGPKNVVKSSTALTTVASEPAPSVCSVTPSKPQLPTKPSATPKTAPQTTPKAKVKTPKGTPKSSKSSVTPKASTPSILDSALTSPDLMRKSPSPTARKNTPKNPVGTIKAPLVGNSAEQPMDIDDDAVIVLD